jgi:hypothetical protein
MFSDPRKYAVVVVNRKSHKPAAIIIDDTNRELAQSFSKHFNRQAPRSRVAHLKAYAVPIM